MNDEKKEAHDQQEPIHEPSVEAEDTSAQRQDDKPRQDDKFIELTKKVMSSTEQFVGSSYKKAKQVVQSSHFEPRATVKLLDNLLTWIRKTFPPDMFDSLSDRLVTYGHMGLVAAQILMLVFGLVAVMKESTWLYIGYALLFVVLQYIADKFISAGKSLIESSPSRLRSEAFLDSLFLLAEIVGIIIFIKFCFLAKDNGQWSQVLIGLFLWCLCDGVAYLALNPSMVNISLAEDVRAGEEAIGIMSFFVKAVVRMVPIAFGIGILMGMLGLLYGIASGNSTTRLLSLNLIAVSTCLPFVCYVFFAFYHLIIDLMQAVLVRSHKIDK